MLLADDIVVVIGGEAVTLRPSLACAIRLERAPGGFQRLIREVQDETLAAACEIIAPHHNRPDLATLVFDAGLPRLAEPLVHYVLACAGVTSDGPAEPEGGKIVSFAEHLHGLYRIGTGWLGWTPQATLAATPLEIMEAYKGRLELLKSIFGGADDAPQDENERSLDDKFKAAFASFGTTIVQRNGEAK